ncbi:MAG: mechanosensitive ion channel family protein [Myxococcota bacterium]|nr:mechanosensitive ion channel family protein [Myxococcota bacterium]
MWIPRPVLKPPLVLALALFCWLGTVSPVLAAEAGTGCATPRQAIYGLLYWLQTERFDPVNASACQDRTGLANPEVRGPELAVKLKKIVDSRGLLVNVDALPDKGDYVNEMGQSAYALFPAELDGVEVVKQRDRWVFSASTLSQIPGIYDKTFPPGLEAVLSSLPKWSMPHFLGMAVWQWLGLLSLLVIAWFVRIFSVALLHVAVKRFANRVVGWEWLKELLGELHGPVGGFALALVLVYVQPFLQLPVELATVLRGAGRLIASVSSIWLSFIIIDAFGDGLQSRADATESRMDDQLVPLIRKSLKVVVSVLGLLWILQGFQVDVTSLVATASVASLGVALAAKDTVANLFGSLMVFLDNPFQIGDYVKVGGGVSGTVEEVGFRTSRLRTPAGSLITIPNARMTDTHVENLGARTNRRYDTAVGLTYDTPADVVQAFCEGVAACMKAHPVTDKSKENIVRFIGFGPSSLDIMVRCWFSTTSFSEEMASRHALNMEILRLGEALGASFAFPSQSLYVEQMPGSEGEAPEASGDSPSDVAQAFGPAGNRARKDWMDVKGLEPDPDA